MPQTQTACIYGDTGHINAITGTVSFKMNYANSQDQSFYDTREVYVNGLAIRTDSSH